MLPDGQYLCHGNQRPRRRAKVDCCGQQSAYASPDLHLRHCHGSLHRDSDELLQQSLGHLFDQCVSNDAVYTGAVADLAVYRVNPIYYVFFSSATIIASMILFKGLNTSGGVNTLSLLCGFLTTFLGVYLLNLSRSIPSGQGLHEDGGRHRRRVSHSVLETGILNPRISISSDHQMGEMGQHSFDSAEDGYPLKHQNHQQQSSPRASGNREDQRWRSEQGSRSSIAGYNHQHQHGGYASVSNTDVDREGGHHRSPRSSLGNAQARKSQADVVFDVGQMDDTDDELINDSGHARDKKQVDRRRS